MLWPDDEQIKEAIMHQENILDIDVRKRFKCELIGRRGRVKPSCCPGGFCIAFEMKDDYNRRLCYRVWRKRPISDLKERLQLISNALQSYKLPYFVGFQYVEFSLNVNGMTLPGVRMDWVEGSSLGDFLRNKPSAMILRKLATDFMTMCQTFERLGIAHGDLSNANIYITPGGEIRLVDYDSVYVPSMGNLYMQSTGGLDGFQHPYRINNVDKLKVSAKDDYFSQQVIYLSLLALSFNPALSSYIDIDLLFNKNDYDSDSAFIASRGYKAIAAIKNDEVQARLAEFRRTINGALSSVRSICDFEMPKRQKSANYCIACGHQFTNAVEHYCISCGAQRVSIN